MLLPEFALLCGSCPLQLDAQRVARPSAFAWPGGAEMSHGSLEAAEGLWGFCPPERSPST